MQPPPLVRMGYCKAARSSASHFSKLFEGLGRMRCKGVLQGEKRLGTRTAHANLNSELNLRFVWSMRNHQIGGAVRKQIGGCRSHELH